MVLRHAHRSFQGTHLRECRKKRPRAVSKAMRRAMPVLGTGRPVGSFLRYHPKRPLRSSEMAWNRSPFSMYSWTKIVCPTCKAAT